MDVTPSPVETPPARHPPAPAPPGTPGPPARVRGIRRFLLAPLAWAWRRPGRALALLTLLALAGLAAAVAGRFLWFDHHLRAARRAVELGHNAVAADHLLACRRVRPDHPEMLLLSARVARRSGAWDDAEELLERCGQQRGDDEDLVLERLLLRATRGEVEAVRAALQVHIDTRDAFASPAREALIAGLLHRFRLREAGRQLDRWLAEAPDDTRALLLRGKYEEARENFEGASVCFRRLVEVDPEHDEGRMRLTTVLLQQHQAGEALPHLEELRRRLPNNPDVMAQLGAVLDRRGRFAEARAVLDECLRRHPDHAAALAERGWIAARDGDGEQAEEMLRRAVALDPADFTARYHYYQTLSRNGKKAEAEHEQKEMRRMEADIERIHEIIQGRLQATPNDPDIHYEVATIVLRAGRPREMLHWLHNALQIDPGHAPTHRLLASFYHETGNPILAARHRALAQRAAGSAERTK
jgi:tetratricopeptide (TPR) repeat protein